MAILTRLINQRAEWAERSEKSVSERVIHLRRLWENVLLVLLGVVLYLYHETILTYLRSFLKL